MQRKQALALVALIVWLILGITLSLIGAAMIKYSQLNNTVAYGAIFGICLGSVLGLVELLAASHLNTSRIMLWMTGSTVAGGIIGFFSIVAWGRFPQGNQADLMFVVFAPVAVVIGFLLGCLLSLILWKFTRK
ncbi:MULTISPECIES: hypothetical protein [unclassified Nodularia (in: cyanobacteria)]|uniref:hypothetical protein n=1 Tax=unclassified Nodularia (in: cyanobacteria) TaxID=2656917 RepID=UPI00188139C4|nr:MULTISPECIES: hypothetical protein [unclassified Nodularia (in: cyanobacteria)]MBE9199155.1 hypothetical protein [Nodularia sp. LEGE 06071]MCC2694095.1 hypothetical protein [Nodularia sp. LEGE 04288]